MYVCVVESGRSNTHAQLTLPSPFSLPPSLSSSLSFPLFAGSVCISWKAWGYRCNSDRLALQCSWRDSLKVQTYSKDEWRVRTHSHGRHIDYKCWYIHNTKTQCELYAHAGNARTHCKCMCHCMHTQINTRTIHIGNTETHCTFLKPRPALSYRAVKVITCVLDIHALRTRTDV